MLRRSSRWIAVSSLVIVSAFMLPALAAASQITFTGVGRGSQVSITSVGRPGPDTISVMAGELNWSFASETPEGFANDFYSYCVDVNQYLSSPQTVTQTSSTGFTNGAPGGGERAAWLFNTYAAGIHSGPSTTTTNIQAAALQVAIWETMYDTNGNLGEGTFILNTTGQIRTQAQIYLNNLFLPGGRYNTSVATILEVISPNLGQDQIVSRVSEPSTLLLMGVAFLVFARRARRSPAERRP